MGFIGDALSAGGSWLGGKAGQALGGFFGLKRGGKVKKVKKAMVETPEKMRKGGRAKKPARLIKGSAAAKQYMAKLRRMKK